MLISFLKKTLFVAAILLLGQIPVGGSNVANYFYAQVGRGLEWGNHELSKYKIFASLTKTPAVWMKKAGFSSDPTPLKKDEPEDAAKDPDGLTPSDRQALMRLLE